MTFKNFIKVRIKCGKLAKNLPQEKSRELEKKFIEKSQELRTIYQETSDEEGSDDDSVALVMLVYQQPKQRYFLQGKIQ